MNTSEDYQQLLADRGITLSDLGLRDVALRRGDALEAIKLLQRDGIPVLGGDAYFHEGSKNSVAYANWYCEPNMGEEVATFSIRSGEKAADYIRQFPEHSGKEVIFVIVFKK